MIFPENCTCDKESWELASRINPICDKYEQSPYSCGACSKCEHDEACHTVGSRLTNEHIEELEDYSFKLQDEIEQLKAKVVMLSKVLHQVSVEMTVGERFTNLGQDIIDAHIISETDVQKFINCIKVDVLESVYTELSCAVDCAIFEHGIAQTLRAMITELQRGEK